jgi:hypothetical protein
MTTISERPQSPRQRAGRAGEGAVAILVDDDVAGRHLHGRMDLMARRAGLQRLDRRAHPRIGHIVLPGGRRAGSLEGVGLARPDHRRAGLPHRRAERVHRRDDVARVRVAVDLAFAHEDGLHVDIDERGVTLFEPFEAV